MLLVCAKLAEERGKVTTAYSAAVASLCSEIVCVATNLHTRTSVGLSVHPRLKKHHASALARSYDIN